ncbi:MAG: hypothetical protein C4576_21470 [Desulfobacteraceae bacterium]|nr:MAG: hypothetical protein C4576_21470 [Desulfobacteraceae bacterium]
MSWLRVLAYHRVADLNRTQGLHPGLISATPDEFARQAAHLAEHYDVLTMAEVLEAIRRKGSLPESATLITFDDGYSDFCDHAWPILKHYNLPATIFIPTAFPGEPQRLFWWDRLFQAIVCSSRERASLPATFDDRLQELKRVQSYVKTMPHDRAMETVDAIANEHGVSPKGRKSTLGWSELRHLMREGLTVAAHTCNHPILTQTPLYRAREEIRGSIEDLERELGSVLPVFCYPNGNSNEPIKRILREEGIDLAFGLGCGFNDLDRPDPWELHRIPITRRTTTFIFRLRLLRLFRSLDQWRHRRKNARSRSASW